MAKPLNDFIIKRDWFLHENGKLVRETGIEDRYKFAMTRTCPQMMGVKDDTSDGLIRMYTDETLSKVEYFGFQECKRLATGSISRESMLAQGLAYVADWFKGFPECESRTKFLLLPTEKYVDILYIDDIRKSTFWLEFNMYYAMAKDQKISPSKLYNGSSHIKALMFQYKNRIKTYRFNIDPKEGLNYKDIVEHIIEHCE